MSKAIRIHKETNKINLLDGNYYGIDLRDLKEWVDKQIENGNTVLQIDLSWGCYYDLDEVNIFATE